MLSHDDSRGGRIEMRAGGRRRAAFGAAFVALGLASCASVPRAGRDWAFTPASRDEPAKLVYGRPYSDDVDLVLWCEAAKREVLFTPVGAEDERFERMVLRSGGETLDLELRQDDPRGSAGGVALNSPLLAAFQKSGRLFMDADGKLRLHLDAQSQRARQRIQDFFAACR